MRFNLKTLLLITGITSVLLGGFLAVHRGLNPNPDSEKFLLDGSQYKPNWTDFYSTESSTGLVASPESISKNYKGLCKNAIRETLFTYKYQDHFGYPSFELRYEISATFDDRWSQYSFVPIVKSTRNSRAHAYVDTKLDSNKKTIHVNIQQGFAASGKSKKCTFVFRWTGEKFKLQNGE